MAKRRYRSVPVKSLDWEQLCEQVGNDEVIVGIDVAKIDMYAAVMLRDLTVVKTVKWKQPEEQDLFVDLVCELGCAAKKLTVAMEPSGVYGDTVRCALLKQEIDVVRVSPKRSHDLAEVYDGVPSLHDAKSAAIVAKLHIDGASEAWPMRKDHERQLAATLRILGLYQKEFKRNRDRSESLLSRYWPELAYILELGSATMLELLAKYGGPAGVADDPEGARALMRQIGGRFLAQEKIDAVVTSAGRTIGVPMIDEEADLVRTVASEARRHWKLSRKAQLRVEKLTEDDPETQAMRVAVGKTTAAVLVAAVGSPSRYDSAAAWTKSLGLNLRVIHDSGKKKSGLHLSKRGPGIARMFLYMAALRAIQRDEVVGAWYQRKVKRQAGKQKAKAVVAVMRKLTMALWHVAKGKEFDSRLLFDTARLKLSGGEIM